MNRAVQKLHQRRCALKSNLYGGGLAVNPEASFMSENGVPYAENQHTNECYTQMRPGALETAANPELAQVGMPVAQTGGYNVMSAAQLAALAGKQGGRRQGCSALRGGMRQGCSALRGGRRSRRGSCLRGGSKSSRKANSLPYARASSRRSVSGGCGCAWKLRGGQCGKPEVAWLGGRQTRKYRMRGGNKGGFEMAVGQNIGGDGPIAEPVRVAVPCDPRAGMQNPFTATVPMPDARAAFGYSLTPNTTTPSVQAGGSLSERVPIFEYAQTGAGYGGNAYDASCYRAPGSEMPVYPATSAGFHFTPSTEGGATLPDGITAFNEVVAHAARLGGAYRKRKSSRKTYRKKAKQSKRSRRH